MLDFKKHLDPIHKDLDDVLEFGSISPNTPLEEEEYPHLCHALELIGLDARMQMKRLGNVSKELDELMFIISNSTGDDKEEAIGDYNRLLQEAQRYIQTANRYLFQINSPYFAKINFTRRRSEKFPQRDITAYVGKFAYFDKNTNVPLVTDWRAPIADVYYKNPGPREDVSFQSPAGKQDGDLTRKLQLDVSRGRISNIYEPKTGNTSADAFLLAELSKRMGKKLQDIVSTIQHEQNQIIRDEINKPVIIQGVAGSGKTTILLHRIAYLVYSQSGQITPEGSLVIAPNKLFLDYISDVLPSLGVFNIGKNTYLNWAKTVLGWNKKWILSSEPDDLEVKEFKGSKLFIDLINKFLTDFESDLLLQMPHDRVKPHILKRYWKLKEEFTDISMQERLDLAIDYGFAQQQFQGQTTGDFMGRLKTAEARITKLKKYTARRLNPVALYKELFKFNYIFENFNVSPTLAKKVRTKTLKSLCRKGKISYYKVEDLASLVWIHFYLNGITGHKKQYLLVDEAQDLSLFQLLTLYRIAKNGNITYAGDLAQSIIPPFFIKDWNDLKALLKEYSAPELHMEYYELNRCYRTTVEVIDYANTIFKKYFPKEYKLPKAVLRHGEKVRIIESDSLSYDFPKKELKKLVNDINNEFEKGSVTVALLCRNSIHADKLYDALKFYESSFERKLVNYNRSDYSDGVLIIPIEKAKGLEFDTVMIMDVCEKYYKGDFLSAKLLYVAVTRALHRLHVWKV